MSTLSDETELSDAEEAFLNELAGEANNREAAKNIIDFDAEDLSHIIYWRDPARTSEDTAETIHSWWETLHDFTYWLIDRYTLNTYQIPDCWFLHGNLVEELSALHMYHKMAYHPEQGGGAGPIGFHRELEGMLSRFKNLYRAETCSETHLPRLQRVFTDYRELQKTHYTQTHTFREGCEPPLVYAPETA